MATPESAAKFREETSKNAARRSIAARTVGHLWRTQARGFCAPHNFPVIGRTNGGEVTEMCHGVTWSSPSGRFCSPNRRRSGVDSKRLPTASRRSGCCLPWPFQPAPSSICGPIGIGHPRRHVHNGADRRTERPKNPVHASRRRGGRRRTNSTHKKPNRASQATTNQGPENHPSVKTCNRATGSHTSVQVMYQASEAASFVSNVYAERGYFWS
jgi:hypothetical protein